MRRASPAFFLLLGAAGGAWAQPVLTMENSFPVEGDSFMELKGTPLDPGEDGAGQVWDFSAFEPTGTVGFTWSNDVSDSLAGCVLQSHPYLSCGDYVLSSDPLSVLVTPWFGYPIGTLPTIHEFSVTLRPPLTFGDTVPSQHLFNLLSNGCDGIMIWRADTSVADGYGTVVLPSGTYGPVLRVHTFSEQANPDADELHSYRYYLPGTHHPLVTIAQGFPTPWDTAWTMSILDPASIVGVGENTADKSELTIRPQPVQDRLFLQDHADARAFVRVEIFDVGGRRRYVQDNMDFDSGIAVDALSPGIYTLRLTCTGQAVRSGRFIKSAR